MTLHLGNVEEKYSTQLFRPDIGGGDTLFCRASVPEKDNHELPLMKNVVHHEEHRTARPALGTQEHLEFWRREVDKQLASASSTARQVLTKHRGKRLKKDLKSLRSSAVVMKLRQTDTQYSCLQPERLRVAHDQNMKPRFIGSLKTRARAPVDQYGLFGHGEAGNWLTSAASSASIGGLTGQAINSIPRVKKPLPMINPTAKGGDTLFCRASEPEKDKHELPLMKNVVHREEHRTARPALGTQELLEFWRREADKQLATASSTARQVLTKHRGKSLKKDLKSLRSPAVVMKLRQTDTQHSCLQPERLRVAHDQNMKPPFNGNLKTRARAPVDQYGLFGRGEAGNSDSVNRTHPIITNQKKHADEIKRQKVIFGTDQNDSSSRAAQFHASQKNRALQKKSRVRRRYMFNYDEEYKTSNKHLWHYDKKSETWFKYVPRTRRDMSTSLPIDKTPKRHFTENRDIRKEYRQIHPIKASLGQANYGRFNFPLPNQQIDPPDETEIKTVAEIVRYFNELKRIREAKKAAECKLFEDFYEETLFMLNKKKQESESLSAKFMARKQKASDSDREKTNAERSTENIRLAKQAIQHNDFETLDQMTPLMCNKKERGAESLSYETSLAFSEPSTKPICRRYEERYFQATSPARTAPGRNLSNPGWGSATEATKESSKASEPGRFSNLTSAASSASIGGLTGQAINSIPRMKKPLPKINTAKGGNTFFCRASEPEKDKHELPLMKNVVHHEEHRTALPAPGTQEHLEFWRREVDKQLASASSTARQVLTKHRGKRLKKDLKSLRYEPSWNQ